MGFNDGDYVKLLNYDTGEISIGRFYWLPDDYGTEEVEIKFLGDPKPYYFKVDPDAENILFRRAVAYRIETIDQPEDNEYVAGILFGKYIVYGLTYNTNKIALDMASSVKDGERVILTNLVTGEYWIGTILRIATELTGESGWCMEEVETNSDSEDIVFYIMNDGETVVDEEFNVYSLDLYFGI